MASKRKPIKLKPRREPKKKRTTFKQYSARKKLVRNWSAIKNLHKNLTEGKKSANARALFFAKTGLKQFDERRYQKALEKGTGTGLSLEFVRSAHAKIVKEAREKLQREYRLIIKDNVELELRKQFSHLPKKVRQRTTLKKWIKKNARLVKRETRLAKRAFSYNDFIKANKATLEPLETFESIEELYNSPD